MEECCRRQQFDKMLQQRIFSNTYFAPFAKGSNEGLLGEPVNLIKERVKSGFPSNLISFDSNNLSDTQLSDVMEPRTTTNQSVLASTYPYDDWELDLHKLKPTRPLDDFISKQKYGGVVLNISETSFFARLQNITENGNEEEAEFAIDELSEDDMPLLKEGAFFYWNIGYLICHGGRKIGCHMINFRRIPVWSHREINAASTRIESLLSWLKIDD